MGVTVRQVAREGGVVPLTWERADASPIGRVDVAEALPMAFGELSESP